MDRVEGQVEEERVVLVPIDEGDGLTREGIGQVIFLLDDLGSPVDRRTLAGEVGVSTAEETEEFVEPPSLRLKLRCLTQVPLANQARGVARGLEPISQGRLTQREAETCRPSPGRGRD